MSPLAVMFPKVSIILVAESNFIFPLPSIVKSPSTSSSGASSKLNINSAVPLPSVKLISLPAASNVISAAASI